VFSAVRDGADHSIVDLTTFMQEDINYTLSVSNVIEDDSRAFPGDVDPFIVSVSSYSNTEVVVFFSEEVDLISAQDALNYDIPGLSIFSASRDAVDHTRVMLDTSPQADATIYTLTVTGVNDLNYNLVQFPNYEDFYGTGPVDLTEPIVLAAAMVDSDTVEVQFSEPMEQGSVEMASNYTLRDNLGGTVFVSIATRQPDPARVRLDIMGTFSEALYMLTVNQSVTDLNSNNLAGSPFDTLSFEGEGLIPQTIGDGPVMIDPLGEGVNNFSMLASYRGRIYIGPANDDNAVFRMKPDGTNPELVSFRFNVGPVYSNSLDPGPDGEDGIDCIAGGIIGGDEYLFIGPSKSSGDLGYVYYTMESGNNLDFNSMDFDAILGGYTVGVSAMQVFNNSLYIGFPDTVFFKPYLYKVVNLVQSPVIDLDVFNLDANTMPRIGAFGSPNNGGGILGIDTFGVYQNRLFLGNGGSGSNDNDGGIIGSTVDDPDPFDVTPGHWQDVTPTFLPEWYDGGNRHSMELPSANKIIPGQKAFPAMAVFNGRLYLIRNTEDFSNRPQLWMYDGITWTLISDNGSGGSDMGNADNTAASLLAVNGDRLYIGYDNSTSGAQLWRTGPGITDPLFIGDFEPVSTDGFGDPAANERIYYGLSISSDGADYLWILSGRSGGTISVYRTTN
jgi:hypothetical protein